MFRIKKHNDTIIIKTPFECQRNNLTIRGTEYKPVAIVCHGFMAFQDTVKQYAIELSNMGYLTYTFVEVVL